MKKIMTLVISIGLTIGMTNIAHAKNTYNLSRIYGENRYKTSVNICKSFCDGSISNVIIASGDNFPDALAGSVLSKKLNAPILLVDKNINESSDSIRYIKNNLSADGNIYVLGGNASVSEGYVNNLKSMGFNNIVRLGGSNRFDTNKTIVNSMRVQQGTPVVIANGYGFADALSVSSVAASKGYPILMSDSKSLPSEIISKIRDIQPSKVYLIGGQGSLSNNIVTQVKNIVPSLDYNNIVRIGGSTRYDTSLEICKYFSLQSDTAVIASGENFPDALSGSALASKSNSPIILTDGKDVSNQKKYLDDREYKNLILLGGTGGISEISESILKGTINELDIINSKSDYKFNLKDSNGENYSLCIYSDNKQIKTASFDSEYDWAYPWAGAAEGDRLSKGQYKIAVAKQGEDTPKIYDLNSNDKENPFYSEDNNLVLNLDRELIRVHKNTQEGAPDVLLVGTPASSNGSYIKVYYIKDGKLTKATFPNSRDGGSLDYDFTFNSQSLFFNQREDGIFETASYDNAQTFGFYIHSLKFDVEAGNFIPLGSRFMSRDDYFNYAKNLK